MSRCEDYAISLLEQCEDLREVETFLQTRNSGNKVGQQTHTYYVSQQDWSFFCHFHLSHISFWIDVNHNLKDAAIEHRTRQMQCNANQFNPAHIWMLQINPCGNREMSFLSPLRPHWRLVSLSTYITLLDIIWHDLSGPPFTNFVTLYTLWVGANRLKNLNFTPKMHLNFKLFKDANYILAILDSRMKFVAHERFQYVLIKKFGE